MGIRRACSYKVTFHTPEAPPGYSAILITIQQDGANIINKTGSDSGVTVGDDIVLELNQEETALLTAGTALIQIRCYASEYNAPGSKVWAVDVWPALNDSILPEGGE